MRKLDLAQRKDQMRNKKDDPVVAHYDKKTEYSFPKIRLDAISKKRTQIEYSNELESRFTSLEQDNAVSEDVQRYLKPNKRELWLPKEQTKEIERGIWNENYLKRLHETLKNFRRKKYPKRRLPAKCVSYESPNISIEKTTPTLPSSLFDDHLDKDYQDNVLIQKTVKGRAIQSMLLRGMKKFHDVIEEAKETHSIAAVRKLFPKEFSQQIDNQEQILNEYKRIEEALKNDKKLQEELKKVESKDAGNLLNFLEKEFNRLQGEKRAHAMYLLAERERYRREAETLGKKDFDDQFKNDAITLYLENILLDGINRAVDDDSCEYIRKVARKLDKKASKTVTFHEAIEEFSNESNTEDVSDVYEIPDENVVVELLKDNMVPQIMDRIKNEQKIAHQKKLLMQAHIDLYFDEFEQIKFEEKQEICSSILDEIIQNATYEEEIEEISEFKPSRQNSAEAEALASQIVEQILNEIMENENFDISVSVTESSTSRDYDGDDSNVQSTSETESSTDYLAKEIVVGVLNDIIESGIVSTSEYTEETSDSY
ncbi:hypothetical protein PVAND_008839 [Polypedilum vanderplanki]|uniref:Uncharacterized protein n=1 Tax=Polypedilum vanderplanki TaxID=319348 RepID=A0A9J6CBZ8_POLVA|nr:hypothetical protein PVAND_008839 [Polypedilum vanderplanki]